VVLGANDGVLSIASIAIGVAAASELRNSTPIGDANRFGCMGIVYGGWKICFYKFSDRH